jgi:hypothetical protein
MYSDRGHAWQSGFDGDAPSKRSGRLLRSALAPRAERPSADPSTEEPFDAWPEAALPPHWLSAARVYADALHFSEIPGARAIARGATAQIISLGVEPDGVASLVGRLKELHRRLSPGDIVLVDAANISRELVALAFFEGGFDCPLIWAGRKVLRAEPSRRLLSRFLSLSALGSGPHRFPRIALPLYPRANRIIAMARRSDLSPPAERNLRLSVVMPVYNERSTVREVLDGLLDKTLPGFEIEICIVESNSTDGTRDEVLRYADHPRVRLALEGKPSGKGHAVRAGLAAATGDFVLIQDADLEYDLDDYEKLLAPLSNGRAGFVLGSRHRSGERVWDVRQFADQPTAARVMNLGHLIFAWMLNVVFGQRMRDPFTMFKVFRRDAIHNVRFECNRFDFDIELVGKLIRQGYSPLEVDISYNSRSFNEGKKVSVLRDPPTWVKACLKHRFSRLHLWPGST